MSERLSGLARILSSQPLPLTPMFRTDDPTRIAAEMEMYARNLQIYLQDLFGQLTAENLITTINNGGGIGFDKVIKKLYLYEGTDGSAVHVTLDSTIDWRECAVLWTGRANADLDDLKNNMTTVDPELIQACNTSYDYDLFQIGDGSSEPTGVVYVNTDGNLKMRISNPSSPSSVSGYIFVFAAAFGRIGSITATSVGNGL